MMFILASIFSCIFAQTTTYVNNAQGICQSLTFDPANCGQGTVLSLATTLTTAGWTSGSCSVSDACPTEVQTSISDMNVASIYGAFCNSASDVTFNFYCDGNVFPSVSAECEPYLCFMATDESTCTGYGNQCTWNAGENNCNNGGYCVNEETYNCFATLPSSFVQNFPASYADCTADCAQCASDIASNNQCSLITSNTQWTPPTSCGYNPAECLTAVATACGINPNDIPTGSGCDCSDPGATCAADCCCACNPQGWDGTSYSSCDHGCTVNNSQEPAVCEDPNSSSSSECSSNSDCGSGSFCNFDATTSGQCETCVSALAGCDAANLSTQEGTNACNEACGSAEPCPGESSCADDCTSTPSSCTELQSMANGCASSCSQCMVDIFNNQLGCSATASGSGDTGSGDTGSGDTETCSLEDTCGDSCSDSTELTCATLQAQALDCASSCSQCVIDLYNDQLGCTGDDRATAAAANNDDSSSAMLSLVGFILVFFTQL